MLRLDLLPLAPGPNEVPNGGWDHEALEDADSISIGHKSKNHQILEG